MKYNRVIVVLLILVFCISCLFVFIGCSKKKYENAVLGKNIIQDAYTAVVDYYKENGFSDCEIRIVDTYVSYIVKDASESGGEYDDYFAEMKYIIQFTLYSEYEVMYYPMMAAGPSSRYVIVYKDGTMKCFDHLKDALGREYQSALIFDPVFPYIEKTIWCGCAYNMRLTIDNKGDN